MSGEPAGKIVTRSAGSVEIQASLEWRSPQDAPHYSLFPAIPAGARFSLQESSGSDGTSRLVSGRLHAFRERILARVLDLVLRSLTSQAALTEAVLETRVVRLATPQAPQASLVEKMAHELWCSGQRVTFGPSWEPICDVDLPLGAAGFEDELVDLLRCSGGWEIASQTL